MIAAPTDAPDERIDVGVLIVGGGPAGLACAIRLGQLLEDDPATAERLGEVPVALVDKGKQPGSHLLSGAVMNPRAVRRLFRGRPEQLDGIPTYGEVPGEGVYLLTRKRALRIPPPPTLRNHGNWIVSISQMSRYLAEQAEASGTFVLPETSADRLLVEHGRVVGIRSGDKGRGKENEPLGNFEPGADIAARVTVLAEGTAGHLTGAALDHFGLNGREPQIWELGVKEIWRVPKPLTKIVHTLGWPLRKPAKYREFGGSWLYPMGDDMISLGFVVGLDYRDVELSAHDLLQEFKTHPFVRKILDGGERVAWGAKTITSGGWHAMPRQPRRARAAARGRERRARRPRAAEGRALRDRVRPARGRGRVSGRCSAARARRGSARSTRTTTRCAPAISARACTRCATCARPSRRASSSVAALASAMTVTKGKLPPKEFHNEPNAASPLLRTDRASRYPGARRQAHVRQALVGVRLRQPHARRPAESRPRRAARAARGGRDVGVDVPGAGLRGRGRRR